MSWLFDFIFYWPLVIILETYQFISLLKRAGIDIAYMNFGVPGYPDALYLSYRKNNSPYDLSHITSMRYAIRIFVHIIFFIAVCVLVYRISVMH